MAALRHATVTIETPSFDALVEAIDTPQCDDAGSVPGNAMSGEILTYRSSPDGSVTIGTDPETGQVVLIVQNAKGLWEVALPMSLEQHGASATQVSFADAKHLAETAFAAHRNQSHH